MNIWTHLWFATLVITDRLLGTNIVERELIRLKRQMEAFENQATAIQQQMEELSHLLHVTQVELCVIYLRQRHILQPETWLRFAPAGNADDESELDIIIDRLVKHNLAAIRTEAISGQTYVYHLRPDWAAISDLMNTWRKHIDPATASWLEKIRNSENGKIHH